MVGLVWLCDCLMTPGLSKDHLVVHVSYEWWDVLSALEFIKTGQTKCQPHNCSFGENINLPSGWEIFLNSFLTCTSAMLLLGLPDPSYLFKSEINETCNQSIHQSCMSWLQKYKATARLDLKIYCKVRPKGRFNLGLLQVLFGYYDCNKKKNHGWPFT